MTAPFYALPRTLTDANHVKITYADTSTAQGTIGASTSYITGLTGSLDLLELLRDALDAMDTQGATWTVSEPATGLPHRVTISSSGGASAPTKLTFLTSELTSRDLGLSTAPGSPDDVTLTASAVTGTYQARWVWTPGESLSQDLAVVTPWTVGAQSRTSSSSILHYLGSVTDRTHTAQYLAAARIYDLYRAQSGYAGLVSGLSTSDPNFTLERFLHDHLSLIADGVSPSLRYYSSALASGEYLSWTDAEHLGDMEGMARVSNEGPLLYDVSLRFREV